MNECLSAVLLTPVDKREEFYHLACWPKIDLLVNFLSYFIIVLLINLHHTVEYVQLQIFYAFVWILFLYKFFWTFFNGFEISIKFCVFSYTHQITHRKRLQKIFFPLKVNQNIFFQFWFQTNKVLNHFTINSACKIYEFIILRLN